MSQVTSLTLASGITGTQERTQLNSMMAALNSLQSGTSRPTTAVEGTMWLDVSAAPTGVLLKVFDGSSTDIVIGTLNLSAETFTPSGQLATFANASVNKTGGFTLDSTFYGQLITCDATSAAITISMADASTLGTSWYAIVKKTDSTSNAVTINAYSAQFIDGLNSVNVAVQSEGFILIKTSSTTIITLAFGNNTVKQSSSDTTPGYINQKVVAGDGIALSTLSPGGNEQMSITFNMDTNPALEFNTGKIRVKVDGTTITRGASGISANVGTGANQIVQLDSSARLPAVNGSQLTGLTPSQATSSSYGIVKPDNSSITISGGVISAPLQVPGYGGVGGLFFGTNQSGTAANSNYSGSSLYFVNMNYQSGASPGATLGANAGLSGTWRALTSSTGGNGGINLFQRIS